MKFLIGILIASAISLFTYCKKTLTLSASLLAFTIIFSSYFFGGMYELGLLILSYGLVAIIDVVFDKRIKKVTREINKKSGTRDFIQVLVNGLPALISVLLFHMTQEPVFTIAYTIAITEALADSIASDIGVLSKSQPVDICTFKPIEKGMSGGISLLGTFASMLACLLCSGIYFVRFHDMKMSFVILVGSFLGCLIDSILGSRIQAKYRCAVCDKITEKNKHCDKNTIFLSGVRCIDNCMVNFISNTFSVLFAILIV